MVTHVRGGHRCKARSIIRGAEMSVSFGLEPAKLGTYVWGRQRTQGRDRITACRGSVELDLSG